MKLNLFVVAWRRLSGTDFLSTPPREMDFITSASVGCAISAQDWKKVFRLKGKHETAMRHNRGLLRKIQGKWRAETFPTFLRANDIAADKLACTTANNPELNIFYFYYFFASLFSKPATVMILYCLQLVFLAALSSSPRELCLLISSSNLPLLQALPAHERQRSVSFFMTVSMFAFGLFLSSSAYTYNKKITTSRRSMLCRACLHRKWFFRRFSFSGESRLGWLKFMNRDCKLVNHSEKLRFQFNFGR